MGQPNYVNGFEVTVHEHMLEQPLGWRRPRVVFVNSMSDLFHERVPLAFIRRVFEVMRRASWHTFQVLTKRSERLAEVAPVLDWPANVWMGVSIENADYTWRADDLRSTGACVNDDLRDSGACVKFLSLEPLLGPLPGLDLDGIDWAIVGGESGPKARPMREEWVLDIREQCVSAGVPLEGRTWDEMPVVAPLCAR